MIGSHLLLALLVLKGVLASSISSGKTDCFVPSAALLWKSEGNWLVAPGPDDYNVQPVTNRDLICIAKRERGESGVLVVLNAKETGWSDHILLNAVRTTTKHSQQNVLLGADRVFSTVCQSTKTLTQLLNIGTHVQSISPRRSAEVIGIVEALQDSITSGGSTPSINYSQDEVLLIEMPLADDEQGMSDLDLVLNTLLPKVQDAGGVLLVTTDNVKVDWEEGVPSNPEYLNRRQHRVLAPEEEEDGDSELLKISPDILGGILIMIFFLFVLTAAFSCMNDIQCPETFIPEGDKPELGREH